MPPTKDRKTPGVYVTELPAFPPSVAGVETSVPVFIGYTEKAAQPLQPVAIESMADYLRAFGANRPARYAVTPGTAAAHDFEAADADGANGYYSVSDTGAPGFALFIAMNLFYDNGGGSCSVVSAGDYSGTVARQPLLDGIAAAAMLDGPSMIVVPDACLLTEPGDYDAVTQAQLNQAGTLRSRVAILDLPGALDPKGWTLDGLAAQRDAFFAAIAPAAGNFGFGAAYAPALRTTVLSAGDVDFTDLQGTQAGSNLLKSLLAAQATALYGAGTSKERQVLEKLALAFPADLASGSLPADEIAPTNQYLFNTLPLFAQVEAILLEKLNVAAPSGAMAGIWAGNDAVRGVWSAPAGMSIAGVVAPEVVVDDTQQEAYALPQNGNAINILRSFVNRGTVVWGARTLDGNSQDYRYIQVRRTLVYIEQSIKTALNPFVFQQNDAQTWGAATTLLSGFLNDLWKQGALMGASAKDAYSVACGLGSTMTDQDVADGIMVVQVVVSLIHPAEFIVLSFRQQMQGRPS